MSTAGTEVVSPELIPDQEPVIRPAHLPYEANGQLSPFLVEINLAGVLSLFPEIQEMEGFDINPHSPFPKLSDYSDEPISKHLDSLNRPANQAVEEALRSAAASVYDLSSPHEDRAGILRDKTAQWINENSHIFAINPSLLGRFPDALVQETELLYSYIEKFLPASDSLKARTLKEVYGSQEKQYFLLKLLVSQGAKYPENSVSQDSQQAIQWLNMLAQSPEKGGASAVTKQLRGMIKGARLDELMAHDLLEYASQEPESQEPSALQPLRDMLVFVKRVMGRDVEEDLDAETLSRICAAPAYWPKEQESIFFTHRFYLLHKLEAIEGQVAATLKGISPPETFLFRAEQLFDQSLSRYIEISEKQLAKMTKKAAGRYRASQAVVRLSRQGAKTKTRGIANRAAAQRAGGAAGKAGESDRGATAERGQAPKQELYYLGGDGLLQAADSNAFNSMINDASNKHRDNEDFRNDVEAIVWRLASLDLTPRKDLPIRPKTKMLFTTQEDSAYRRWQVLEYKPAADKALQLSHRESRHLRVIFVNLGGDKLGVSGIMRYDEVDRHVKSRRSS